MGEGNLVQYPNLVNHVTTLHNICLLVAITSHKDLTNDFDI